MSAPIAGWDETTWPAATPPCARCGHDGAAETAVLRRRATTDAEHDELVATLLDGAIVEVRPWQAGAYTDAVLAAYAAVLHELAVVTLASLPGAEIRGRLEDVLPMTLPAAVLADVRAELNRLHARCEALGIQPASFRAPTRAAARRVA